MVARKVGILILVSLAVFAGAGGGWEVARRWRRGWIEATGTLIVSKLLMTIVFLLGVSAMGKTDANGGLGALSDALAGMVVMVLVLLCPYATYKFVHWAADGGGHDDLHRTGVAGIGVAAGAAKTAGQLAMQAGTGTPAPQGPSKVPGQGSGGMASGIDPTGGSSGDSTPKQTHFRFGEDPNSSGDKGRALIRRPPTDGDRGVPLIRRPGQGGEDAAPVATGPTPQGASVPSPQVLHEDPCGASAQRASTAGRSHPVALSPSPPDSCGRIGLVARLGRGGQPGPAAPSPPFSFSCSCSKNGFTMLPDASHPGGPATVKFPHRSRRGVLLGLTAPQLTVAATTGLLLLAVLLSSGVTGALKLLPLWALVLAGVFVRHRGRALADWAPIVIRYVLRRWRGQLIWLARPSTRPQREGLLHLPGTAASLRVVTAPSGRFGAVHDPHHSTLTAVVKVSSRAYALLDPATQSSNVSGWGRTLAALARTGHIARVQVLERTVPDSGDALNRYWSEYGNAATPLAGPIYAELLAAAGPAAAPHEAYVSLALDLKEARRLINQAGGGLTGAFAVLAQLTATFDQAARNSGLAPTGWLPATEIAAVIRTAYDPKASAALDRWSSSGRPQADPPPRARSSWSRRPTASTPTRPTTPPSGSRTGHASIPTPASCTSSCSPPASDAASPSPTRPRHSMPR